jgi:WS/DGAT/MGAT family acyltransferase
MASYQRLTGFDASFLEVERASTHMHVAAVLIFDRPAGEAAPLDIDRVRLAVESRLHDFPRYRQRLAKIPLENHPVWVDDPDFNLQYHVRHTCLPPPGDVRLLKRLAGRIMSQKLDRGKPLWELWLVEGLEEGHFATIIKVHHCMVDGISGIELLTALLRPVPEREVPPPPPRTPRPLPSSGELLLGELVHRAGEPIALLRAARRAARDPRGALASLWEGASAVGELFAAGLLPAPQTPLNPPRIGPHRRFDWLRFDLDHVKEVKHRFGGTVNDVVLATVAGAIGQFLRGRRVRGLKKTPFRALVPVNVRGAAERGTLGNRVAQMLAPLPIAERDPVRRLLKVIDTTSKLKHSKQAFGAEILEEISDWTATTVMTQVVDLAARVRTYNLIVTNVPGPGLPLYLLDFPLREIYPMVPLFANQTVGVAIFSYAGGLFWGFNSDWDRVPDLHDLVEGLGLEFEDLRKCAAAKPVRVAARPK